MAWTNGMTNDTSYRQHEGHETLRQETGALYNTGLHEEMKPRHLLNLTFLKTSFKKQDSLPFVFTS